MSDMGYSTSYEVFLTPSSGVQIVTNELSLALLKELRLHEICPTDIASELQLSKSTVQANLTKLQNLGIIKQSTSEDDGRRAVYHMNSIPIFCSDTDDEWQMYARLASDIRILKSGRCTSREDLSLYTASLTESGLNVIQGLYSIGAALAHDLTDEEMQELLKNSSEEQSELHDIKTKIIVNDALELELESKENNISDTPMVVVPMIGALMSHSRNIFGYNLAHDSSLSVTKNGHRVNLRVDRFDGQDYKDNLYDPAARDLNYYRVDEPFSIYSVDGVSTLFTNNTMMLILDVLSEKDMTVNDMAEQTGTSKATIYTAITKLIELGAVTIDKDSGSPKRYKLIADPILYCTKPEVEDCSKLKLVTEKWRNKELDYYSSVIAFGMESMRCMGIHFNKMFMRSGRSTARTVLELIPDMDPQHLMDVACTMVSIPDRAEVITLLPIRIRVTLAQDTLWESWPAEFVKGFVSEGLKILLNDNYKIIVESVREGSGELLSTETY